MSIQSPFRYIPTPSHLACRNWEEYKEVLADFEKDPSRVLLTHKQITALQGGKQGLICEAIGAFSFCTVTALYIAYGRKAPLLYFPNRICILGSLMLGWYAGYKTAVSKYGDAERIYKHRLVYNLTKAVNKCQLDDLKRKHF